MIRAAVTRTSGEVEIGPDERISAEVALSSLLARPSDPGGARTIT